MEFCDEFRNIKIHQQDLNILIADLQLRVKDSRFPAPLVPRTDPGFLSKFIRTKNYNNDSALDSVQRYYANVHRNLSYIKGIRPSMFVPAFESDVIIVLRHRYEGCKIGICRVKNWKPKEVNLRDIQLATVFMAEQYILDKEIQEKGVIVIFDLEGLSFDQIRRLSVRELRRILLTAQEGLPVRVAGVHFLNPPPLFWSIYHMCMRMVKEKIRKRVQLHYSLDSLHKHLDKETLPHSLGGDMSEDEAIERDIIEDLLKKDIPYEEYWNGGMGPNPVARKLSRKRSSLGEFVHAH